MDILYLFDNLFFASQRRLDLLPQFLKLSIFFLHSKLELLYVLFNLKDILYLLLSLIVLALLQGQASLRYQVFDFGMICRYRLSYQFTCDLFSFLFNVDGI